MTIAEFIQRVQSLYSKGVESDDSRLTSRHIYNKMLTIRNKLISQEAKKNQKVNQWNFQTISCVEIIKAPIHECVCLPPVGCQVYRTKNQLPKPMTTLGRHLIESVTSLDGQLVFDEIDWVEKKYKKANKYTGSKPDYYIRNEYMYFTIENKSITQKIIDGEPLNNKIPIVMAITGLFEDPIEVNSFESYCESQNTEDCDSPLDKEFPLDLDMADTLIEMCAKELVEAFSKSLEDRTNDGADSPLEMTK